MRPSWSGWQPHGDVIQCAPTQNSIAKNNESKPMSVLLRSLENSKYVGHPSGWTEQPEEARKFGGATDALFYCHRHQLKNMEIKGKDFTIPLTALSWDRAEQLAD
jgi:hypothetical protein